MANNYTQFSEMLTGLTQDQCDWLAEQLDEELFFPLLPLAEDPDEETRQRRDRDAEKWVTDHHGRPLPEPEEMALFELWREFECLGFQHELTLPSHGQTGELWIHADKCGTVEHVLALIQAFLKKFHDGDVWTMTWACTCSKPRGGEFSGGGAVVTAECVQIMDAGRWTAEQAEPLRRMAAEERAKRPAG